MTLPTQSDIAVLDRLDEAPPWLHIYYEGETHFLCGLPVRKDLGYVSDDQVELTPCAICRARGRR